jgi:citrate synthase
MNAPNSTKTATLTFSDGSPSLQFPIMSGTIGPEVVDIKTLYGKSGRFT